MSNQYENSYEDIWWNDDKVVNYERLKESVTDDMISKIATKYNKELPQKYLELIKKQNGGRLIKRCFIHAGEEWMVDAIYGISSNLSNDNSIEYLTDEIRERIVDWNLTSLNPNDIVVFASDESGGHAYYVLDYSSLNENNEPKIVYFDTELDEKYLLANSFEEFVSGLVFEE